MNNLDFSKILIIGLLSMIATAILTGIFIPFLKRMKVGQEVRDDGPQSHLKKSGTPTMGGIVIALVVLIFVLFFVEKDYKTTLVLVTMLGFGLIGFLDDAEKMLKKQSLGLTPNQKLILQFALAFLVLIVIYILDGDVIKLVKFPFVEKPVNLSIFSIPLLAFVMVGTVNAVNLTDGLDGLLVGVSLPVFISFLVIAVASEMSNMSLISVITLGALIGFLFYNSNPASIFMGDTGSMTIGGLIAIIAIFLEVPIYLIFIGAIYVIEALSVIIQVTYYKKTKKRIFLMSPIHHHFELKGYPEQKITVSFSIVSLIFCTIALILIF